MTPEPQQGNRTTLETEVMIDDADDARQAGEDTFHLFMAFLNGFSSAGDED
jgi:hypothetical protein